MSHGKILMAALAGTALATAPAEAGGLLGAPAGNCRCQAMSGASSASATSKGTLVRSVQGQRMNDRRATRNSMARGSGGMSGVLDVTIARSIDRHGRADRNIGLAGKVSGIAHGVTRTGAPTRPSIAHSKSMAGRVTGVANVSLLNKTGSTGRSLANIAVLNGSRGTSGRVANISVLNKAGTTGRSLANVAVLNGRGGTSGRVANVSVLNKTGTAGRSAVNVSALDGRGGTGGSVANVSILNKTGTTGRPLANVAVLNGGGGTSGKIANVSILNKTGTTGQSLANVAVLNGGSSQGGASSGGGGGGANRPPVVVGGEGGRDRAGGPRMKREKSRSNPDARTVRPVTVRPERTSHDLWEQPNRWQDARND
jgi:hypothetical protein